MKIFKIFKSLFLAIFCFLMTNVYAQGKFFNPSDSTANVGAEYKITFFTGFEEHLVRQHKLLETDAIADFMKRNKTVCIEIGSHSDFRGNEAQNIVLTEKRAKTWRNYIIEKGIDSTRITAVGYGSTQPSLVDSLMSCRYDFLPRNTELSREFIQLLSTVQEQEVAHQINRRTIIKIIKK